MRAVWTIAAKEIREALRDPYVLWISVAFPVLFYPLLLWGVVQLSQVEQGLAERAPPRVAVSGPPEVNEALDGPPLERVDGDPRDGTADVRVTARRARGGLWVDLAWDSTRTASVRAKKRVEERLDTLRRVQVAELALAAGVGPDALGPFHIEEKDIAPPGRTSSHLVSIVLAGVVVWTLMLSALYPSVEIVLGERERGTLETTLVSAASRTALVAGKVFAAVILSLLPALGNAGAMLLTVVQLGVTGGFSAEQLPELSAGDLLLALPVVAGTAVLAVACVVLAVMPTRTFKQAEQAASLVYMLSLLPVAVALLPLVKLNWRTALIPFGNTVLVVRRAVGGGLAVGFAIEALLVNAAIATAALALGSRLVGGESWLLGGGGRCQRA